MTTAGLVLTAIATFASALAAWSPALVAVVALAGGVPAVLLLRGPERPAPTLWWIVVPVVACLIAAVRSEVERDALDSALPEGERVAAVARLVTDPVPTAGGHQVVLGIDGRRHWAFVPSRFSAVVATLLTGDHVTVEGRRVALEDAPVGWTRSRHLVGELEVERLDAGPPAPVWMAVANGFRRNLQRGLSGLDGRSSALAAGLVVGDDRGQQDLDRFRFRASGLGHLLAVSGQNVGLTLVAAGPLLRRVPLRWRWIAGGAVVGAFVLVTRAEPSVLRAAATAGVGLVAASSGRPVDAARALSIAVVVLVLVDPMLVHSVGFQLSVAATAGLAAGVTRISEHLRGPRWWRDQVAASGAATVATLPLQVGTFGVVPVVGLVANLLAVPVAGVVVVLGPVLGSVAGVVHPMLGRVLVWPVGLGVRWVDLVATWSSRVPLGPLDAWSVAVVVAAVALVVAARRRRPGVGPGPAPGPDGSLRPGAAHRAGRRGRHRIPGSAAVVTAVVLVVAATSPRGVAEGRHRLSRAAALEVDGSGIRTVLLASGADPLDVLDALWRDGVHRVDRIVAPDGSTAGEAVAAHHRAERVVPRR